MQTAKQLIFRLGAEIFGVDVMTVCEIVGMQAITTIPGAAAGVKGVINLRGKVVPVLELHKELPTARTSLLVVRTAGAACEKAVVVDEAMDIVMGAVVRTLDILEAK